MVKPEKLVITWNDDDVLIDLGLIKLLNLIRRLVPAFNWLVINPVNTKLVVPLTVDIVGDVVVYAA
jgi:hypothetical protein